MTVVLPQEWHNLRLMVPPPSMKVGDPVTRIVVSSSAIDFGRGCNELDYDVSSKAVAIVVVEWVRATPGRFPMWPRHFTRESLAIRPAPALECWAGPGGAAQFMEHGRPFMAFVLLGRRAAPGMAERARSVLDTLTVK